MSICVIEMMHLYYSTLNKDQLAVGELVVAGKEFADGAGTQVQVAGDGVGGVAQGGAFPKGLP